ncbi:MAG TPA: fumarylacetoacetate hydrolase family protein [Solirubrobacterales bacterium]|jgi:2-keto-4-pentenoate hydratase/2-oxohepta-3-ene-1,7-dioic acid hydratase in catechol pathway|nr:fumarylacetoacetate hydrolase family protein [Solirubrobacterales bacterium]
MTEFAVGSVQGQESSRVVAIAREQVFELPDAPTMVDLLADWDDWIDRIAAAIDDGSLGDGAELSGVDLGAPLPVPRNLYMAGANYADHAREMRKLPADAPIEPSPHGPFFFLKPTTTVIGPDAEVVIPTGIERLDWEVELAAVIGREARGLDAATALSCVAGYMVLNDVSARDNFKREPATEPPMTFDWFGQKGWATSCPTGPWIVPARFVPDPGDLRMSLSVNGEVEQSSSTGEMIFDLPTQIAYLSRVVPLVPGDVIATGTPAGVGAGKGRFLAPGDEMVAAIEDLGELRSRVVAEVLR